MISFIIFLGVLSVLVLIHELGHFLAARWLGIKVEEFAFGLPFTRPLWRLKLGETQYAVYPLLFGGFVRLFGEDLPPEELRDRQRSFWHRGRKQRMLVIAAGVVMNLVLALALFVGVYAVVGVPRRTVNKVTIIRVEPGSPAAAVGLLANDRIVAVEGRGVERGAEFGRLMRSWAGLAVKLTVERGEGVPLLEGIAQGRIVQHLVTVTPRLTPPADQGPLGVGIADYPYLEMAQCSMLNAQCTVAAIGQGFVATWEWIVRVIEDLRGIGRNLAQGRPPEGVAGPIGIYQLTDVVAQGGVLPVLELVAVLSVNLAVFNVLPVPALDGGRMFFVWLEWVRRRRLPANLEQRVNSVGMSLLLALMAMIMLQDVVRTGILEKIFR